ncbi:NAD(P)/FAD-dependent oxidoreductase [Nocardia uniformis]|uniref:NAD(P)/FAD-dependent oxidoreductase n=1 Tax=Nocardia uniformis TaxID=53432 RepID=A0A849CGV5_9NOCA|nr:NAD(P)/FAD-dependent oxidoreductase [Nocardia uniformis]NNH72761.1 NAD(P)/FAD-dependent oxidoreductase [Nocardia uniformis]
MIIKPDHEFVIIGSGCVGMAAGIMLKKHGLHDFIIAERFDKPGGTWNVNTYPGIGCDIPTPWYEFFFDRNKNWSRFFPKGAEINAYHNQVAVDHGLGPHFRCNTDVTRQTWDEDNHLWRLSIADGSEITARYVIAAIGQFSDPSLPTIPGVDDFTGKLQQPARWDHSYDWTGKRVIVVGTGASALQIIPEVAKTAGNLEVFQRTPIFCVYKPDFENPKLLNTVLASKPVSKLMYPATKGLFDGIIAVGSRTPVSWSKPGAIGLDALTRTYYRRRLNKTVEDPQTRTALMPDYGLFTKRPALSNTYLPTFNQDNVQLVTTSIDRIEANGVRTTDGVLHECDMLVLATGYKFFHDPLFYKLGWVIGRNGFDMAADFRENGVAAYESMAVPKVPNRWMLAGPYSWNHTPHTMAEYLGERIAKVVLAAKARGITALEVDETAHREYHATTRERSKTLEWYMTELHRGNNSYYVNSHGQFAAGRLVSWREMERRTRRDPLRDYRCRSLRMRLELSRTPTGTGSTGAPRVHAGQ